MNNKKQKFSLKNFAYFLIITMITFVVINKDFWQKKISNNVSILNSQQYNCFCEVYFTPGDNCTAKIVNEIKNAQKEILVQTYSFTSKSIVNALIEQHKNNIKVIVICDNSQKNNIILIKLKNENIPVYIDKMPGIAHNKVMIIDDKTVLTGSFNFTEAAQNRNAENSVILLSEEIAQKYKNNFNKRLAASKKL